MDVLLRLWCFIGLAWLTGLSRKDSTSNSTFVSSEEVKKTVSGKQGNVSSRYFWLLYLVWIREIDNNALLVILDKILHSLKILFAYARIYNYFSVALIYI